VLEIEMRIGETDYWCTLNRQVDVPCCLPTGTWVDDPVWGLDARRIEQVRFDPQEQKLVLTMEPHSEPSPQSAENTAMTYLDHGWGR
jgi:hypothetical protein